MSTNNDNDNGKSKPTVRVGVFAMPVIESNLADSSTMQSLGETLTSVVSQAIDQILDSFKEFLTSQGIEVVEYEDNKIADLVIAALNDGIRPGNSKFYKNKEELLGHSDN